MKILIFNLSLLFICQVTNAQEIGEIREVTLILEDIPISGDAIQPNFITTDSNEIFSFNHTDWLDKHVSLFSFYHTYRDSCLLTPMRFSVTMIYIPIEQYTYVRYEGYIPTGEVGNTWVLTSILRAKDESE